VIFYTGTSDILYMAHLETDFNLNVDVDVLSESKFTYPDKMHFWLFCLVGLRS